MSKKAREQTDPNTVYRGLHLDDETLKMIYHDNAKRVFGK
jgi:predicted TIM-barrel fold metal-dependent hydrolase